MSSPDKDSFETDIVSWQNKFKNKLDGKARSDCQNQSNGLLSSEIMLTKSLITRTNKILQFSIYLQICLKIGLTKTRSNTESRFSGK